MHHNLTDLQRRRIEEQRRTILEIQAREQRERVEECVRLFSERVENLNEEEQ